MLEDHLDHISRTSTGQAGKAASTLSSAVAFSAGTLKEMRAASDLAATVGSEEDSAQLF